MTESLVSPVAEQRARRRPAPRLRLAREGMSCLLVDSMLNRSAQWGQGILDAVELRLPDPLHGERLDRPQLGEHHPEAWAQVIAQRHSAAVLAVGD